MKIYKYSLQKVFMNYWLIFILPVLVSYMFFQIGFDNGSRSWVEVLPVVLTYSALAIPLFLVFILLKTEIHINESVLIRKRFSLEKTILWENVTSIERKNMYSTFLDRPRDLIIRDKDNNRINIYGFLKDIEGVEKDILTYSKKEIKNTGKEK